MTFRNVLVTGANRGIGLEFIRQFLGMQPPVKNVIATTRSESDALNQLKAAHSNLHVLNYDSLDYNGLDKFADSVAKIVGTDGLDLLVNNAGMFIRDSLDTIQPENLMKNIETNAVAPLMLTKKLLPVLRDASKQQRKTVVAQITSLMGSIDDNTSGGHYAYRASKTALNMLSKSLATDIKADNIIVLLLHPGWVQTDMGTERAPTTPQESVSGMLKVIENSSIDKTALFVNFAGKELKW